MKAVTRLTLVLASGLTLALALGPAPPSPRVTLGRVWPPADLIPVDRIDHGPWGELLKRYVDDRGGVEYDRWRDTPADVLALDSYLGGLSRGAPDLRAGRDARLAFWINAYNAVTVRGVLRERPTASVLELAAGGAGYNIWRDLSLIVGGATYSLGEIETKGLRAMGEPRAHFAVVCASRGCPRLLNEAYTAAGLDRQLDRNARAFFADRTKFRFDPNSGTLELSPILEWYSGDFGPDLPARLRAIAPYLPEEGARQLAQGGKAGVRFLGYDWGLNGRAPQPAGRSDRQGGRNGQPR